MTGYPTGLGGESEDRVFIPRILPAEVEPFSVLPQAEGRARHETTCGYLGSGNAARGVTCAQGDGDPGEARCLVHHEDEPCGMCASYIAGGL